MGFYEFGLRQLSQQGRTWAVLNHSFKAKINNANRARMYLSPVNSFIVGLNKTDLHLL